MMTRALLLLALSLLIGCAPLRTFVDCMAPAVAAGAREVQPRMVVALDGPVFQPAAVDRLRDEGRGIGWAALACAARALLDLFARPAALTPRVAAADQRRLHAARWIGERGFRFVGEPQ